MKPALLLCCALLACGCNCGRKREPSGSAHAAPRGPSATIIGTVRLAPGVELPRYPESPMISAQHAALPPGCTPAQDSDREPVHLVAGRGLTGVLIALSEFSGSMPENVPETHELVIRDCRLTPPLIAGTRGDRIHLVNETDYPYFPNLGGGLLQALLHGHSRDVELGQAGHRTLQCTFGASCGRAEIMTTYHPLHAVTDDDGHYRIENVPVGQLHVNAWHPLFAETRQIVTLRAGETRTVDLVISPAPPPPARAPTDAQHPPARSGHPEDQPGGLF
jgi:hypothetical protein